MILRTAVPQEDAAARDVADFAGQLLSTLRCGFGGRLEQAASPRAGSR